MSACEPGWSQEILLAARRAKTASTFRGPTSIDTPPRFRDGAPGSANFLAWAALPEMTYSADPDTLYNFKKLSKSMENSDCYAKNVVQQQSTAGVVYPQSFYVGLMLAGTAVLYSLVRS